MEVLWLQIKQYTEDSLTLIFGNEIDENINQQIVGIRNYIEDLNIEGIVETIISYTRLVIYFDVLKTDAKELKNIISDINLEEILSDNYAYRIVEIPVHYGGDFGPDMHLFEAAGLTEEEVIERHANKEYLVYMLGFMPGFVYLGGLDENLEMSRLDTPRTHIPAGSVGIAGMQTGMYPFDSPGGWNLIGRTPVRLYDLRRGENAILYDAGDRIIYRPVSKERYEEILEEVDEGTYAVKITEKGADD